MVINKELLEKRKNIDLNLYDRKAGDTTGLQKTGGSLKEKIIK
jgi:hypothetical protein